MSVTIGFDATHSNVRSLPPGQAAGYATGSADIAWTEADWDAHPGAVRIDQTPASGPWDQTADVDDYENGAVSLDELASRAKLRMGAWRAGTRPGQRTPAVYASASSLTSVVNALIAGGVKSGVGLWVANWNLTEGQADTDINEAAGPFPIIGVQFHSGLSYDFDVFSTAWLSNVSGPKSPPPTVRMVKLDLELPELHSGMKDPIGSDNAVHRVQGLLKAAGTAWGESAMSGLVIDGDFGPATEAAAKTFQSRFGIGPSGYVGPETYPPLIQGHR